MRRMIYEGTFEWGKCWFWDNGDIAVGIEEEFKPDVVKDVVIVLDKKSNEDFKKDFEEYGTNCVKKWQYGDEYIAEIKWFDGFIVLNIYQGVLA